MVGASEPHHLSLNFASAKELIEVNRIVAKVNDRIVTWGEIAKAMDRLNFPIATRNFEHLNLLMAK